MVDRKYIGTDCDVTKVSEKKCGDATVTKYEASVTVDGKNYTSEHTVVDGEASHTVKDSDIKVIKEATCTERLKKRAKPVVIPGLKAFQKQNIIMLQQHKK